MKLGYTNLRDSMACVSFSLLNILEILAKVKFGKSWNKSDRYTAKSTGTTQNGNSMKRVLDTTREISGTVDETTYPYHHNGFSWNEYYKDIPKQVQELGKAWLKDYIVGYEAVWTNKSLMMEALKYSPLYVAGYAWYSKDGLYRSYGRANHAFVVIGYVKGSHWLVFDSYSPYIKKLAWDYDFSACKTIFLDRKEDIYNTDELRWLEKAGYKFVARPDHKGEFYKIKDGTLEHIPNLRDIADDLTKYMKTSPQNLNEVLKFLTEKKHIKWLSEKAYYNLKK